MSDQIPEFYPNPQLDQSTQQLRQLAPVVLVKLIETGVIENPNPADDSLCSTISILGSETGLRSACYLINKVSPLIVKLGIDNLGNEVKWLNGWKSKNVPVPTLIKNGDITITTDTNSETLIYYLIEQVIVDHTGKPAPTALEFINNLAKKPVTEVEPIIKALGESAGRILAQMHTSHSDDDYCIPDEERKPITAKNYSQLLISRFESLTDVFVNNEITADQLSRIKQLASTIKFSSGVYIHGDYCPRNLLVIDEKGNLVVFDPKPLGIIADPHYDLAFQANQVLVLAELAKTIVSQSSNYQYITENIFTQAMFEAYQIASSTSINQQNLVLHQILLLATHIREEEMRKSQGVQFSQMRDSRLTIEKQQLSTLTNQLLEKTGNSI